MKKWYQFYTGILDEPKLQQLVGEIIQSNHSKLQQIGTQMHEEKQRQKFQIIVFEIIFSCNALTLGDI